MVFPSGQGLSPLTWSSPSPPSILSFPPWPVIVSLPPRPSMLSAPDVPMRTSGPLVPIAPADLVRARRRGENIRAVGARDVLGERDGGRRQQDGERERTDEAFPEQVNLLPRCRPPTVDGRGPRPARRTTVPTRHVV